MSLDGLRSYVLATKKDEKNAHGYRAMSAFSMLEFVDLMIKRYLEESHTDKGAILLDVFGMLQGLFVAIDALYDLSIGLTQYKYHVNVNANPILHELKYIRNDIVGHPTHRTYPNGGMGFSMLSKENLTKEKFCYETYIFDKNQLDVKTTEVLLKPLMDAYHIEKDKLLADLLSYLKHQDVQTTIPEELWKLFETLNRDKLIDIKQMFMKEYDVKEDSSHRFIWRLNLLEKLILWHEDDQDITQFLTYAARYQVTKLYDMSLDLEHRRGESLYVKIPKILLSFFRFISSHEAIAVKLLHNLHDYNHPLYRSDLLALLALNPNAQAAKILHFLKDQVDEQNVYIIGSILRTYRLKK